MLNPVDNWFSKQDEPAKNCLQFSRQHILKQNPCVIEKWQYGMPFYYCNGRRFCYLWVHKKLQQPYPGIVEGQKIQHPELVQEKRTRMKIFLVDSNKNVPVRKINVILKEALKLCRKN